MQLKFLSIAVTSLTFSLATTLFCVAAQAANLVGVYGNRFDLTTINDFYNSGLTVNGMSVSSNILTGTLDTNNLSNINLLWLVQPASSYTPAEIQSLSLQMKITVLVLQLHLWAVIFQLII
jgi:hypothetical protein